MFDHWVIASLYLLPELIFVFNKDNAETPEDKVSNSEPENVGVGESRDNEPRPAGTRRKFLAVRRVPKNRQNAEEHKQAEAVDQQDFGFRKRFGDFFSESGVGKPVHELTEREERFIRSKVKV